MFLKMFSMIVGVMHAHLSKAIFDFAVEWTSEKAVL